MASKTRWNGNYINPCMSSSALGFCNSHEARFAETRHIIICLLSLSSPVFLFWKIALQLCLMLCFPEENLEALNLNMPIPVLFESKGKALFEFLVKMVHRILGNRFIVLKSCPVMCLYIQKSNSLASSSVILSMLSLLLYAYLSLCMGCHKHCRQCNAEKRCDLLDSHFCLINK